LLQGRSMQAIEEITVFPSCWSQGRSCIGQVASTVSLLSGT
jgi:hypothetical protein